MREKVEVCYVNGYNKRKLSSLRYKNCDAILDGMIYAVAFIDMM